MAFAIAIHSRYIQYQANLNFFHPIQTKGPFLRSKPSLRTHPVSVKAIFFLAEMEIHNIFSNDWAVKYYRLSLFLIMCQRRTIETSRFSFKKILSLSKISKDQSH